MISILDFMETKGLGLVKDEGDDCITLGDGSILTCRDRYFIYVHVLFGIALKILVTDYSVFSKTILLISKLW
jgi:hypothetical protein